MSDADWKNATSRNVPRILHADADAFFVSVARLVDPEGAGSEPLLIVGGASDSRGVVTSASYETRKFGVRSGMPTAQALRLCPEALCVPVPGSACRDKSREIRRVLERLAPIVEPASIDEFYLDLTGTERLYNHVHLSNTAIEIRRTVLEETGIAVYIGGGTSRLVAKLASKSAKPHDGDTTGVMIVEPGGERSFLERLQLADIPGIGPRFQERLAVRGLRSVKDALGLSKEELIEWLGQRGGQWLYNKVRGVDTAHVAARSASKSMSHERTFATDLHDDGAIDKELQRLALNVAADLRAKGRKARTITVKIRDADFTTRQASRTLPSAVSADSTICETARKLTTKLRKGRRLGVRLLGVAVSRFQDDEPHNVQLSLLDSETTIEEPLLRAVDNINEKFGRHSIVRASTVGPDTAS